MGPGPRREGRVGVEERPGRELGAHGHEVLGTLARRCGPAGSNTSSNTARTGCRRGPREVAAVAAQPQPQRLEPVGLRARAGDRVDAVGRQEGPARLDERRQQLPVAGERVVEQQGPVGEAAHRQVLVPGQRLEAAAQQPADARLGVGQPLGDRLDRRERVGPAAEAAPRPRAGAPRRARARAKARGRLRLRRVRRRPPAARRAATPGRAPRPSRPCRARTRAARGCRPTAAAGARTGRGRPRRPRPRTRGRRRARARPPRGPPAARAPSAGRARRPARRRRPSRAARGRGRTSGAAGRAAARTGSRRRASGRARRSRARTRARSPCAGTSPSGVSSRSGSKSRSRSAKRTTRSDGATSRLTAATIWPK